ncbi:DEAD/DEAH box helicase [Klebsiella variicola]|uniref:DEAD/DEAH box helicase n=1 Tax=Klebsiella variicola TaxID=244366 RepID=UPI003F664D85
MIDKNKVSDRSGIHETVRSLTDNLRQYIEAQYHIRDEGLIDERRALLQKDETIAQVPYIEATPVYESGITYSELPIPKVASDILTQLSEMGVGLYPRPYQHQSQALTSFLGDEKSDLVIATGTGSGKTESFLMPIIGNLAIEATERPKSASMPGCRAILLYPMNALVNDQLARIRRLFGDSEASKCLWLEETFLCALADIREELLTQGVEVLNETNSTLSHYSKSFIIRLQTMLLCERRLKKLVVGQVKT